MCTSQCGSQDGLSMTRELCMSCGKIVHCRGCGSVGFEFGTSYMIFNEGEFLRFASWMQRLTWKSIVPGKNKLYIQVQGDQRIMLGLTRSEFGDICMLCDEATRWLPRRSDDSSAASLHPVSALVH